MQFKKYYNHNLYNIKAENLLKLRMIMLGKTKTIFFLLL